MARCLVVQHLGPEGPYLIGDALAAAGVAVDVRRTFVADPLPPDVSEFDGLVVMGGPMSAMSDDDFPTRRAELRLLEDALGRGVPTIGVCLGAQLLALAGGGTARPGAAGPEVGWGPVDLSEAATGDPLMSGLPERLSVLHWHWDTFDPGPEAVHLASNNRYHSQAFRTGPLAWGLQFHVEVDETAIKALLEVFALEARAAGADPESIAAISPAMLSRLAPHRTPMLSRFAQLVATADLEAAARPRNEPLAR